MPRSSDALSSMTRVLTRSGLEGGGEGWFGWEGRRAGRRPALCLAPPRTHTAGARLPARWTSCRCRAGRRRGGAGAGDGRGAEFEGGARHCARRQPTHPPSLTLFVSSARRRVLTTSSWWAISSMLRGRLTGKGGDGRRARRDSRGGPMAPPPRQGVDAHRAPPSWGARRAKRDASIAARVVGRHATPYAVASYYLSTHASVDGAGPAAAAMAGERWRWEE